MLAVRIQTETLKLVATTREIEETSGSAALLLVDSRAPDRYRGENETIDPVAGHIPGAENFHYALTLDSQGFYLPPEKLKDLFDGILSGRPPGEAVFYCGSGVSAGQNLVAMAAAGIHGARLYAGSWSEWIADPSRPVAAGAAEPEKGPNQ